MAEERQVEGPPANLERPNRGSHQLIPRPPGLRPGGPPPWAGLDAAQRRFTLDDVRDRLAVLPPPMPSELFDATSRPAAVLVPIYEEHGEARVILTKRPETMTSHRGEIAFPGGKADPDDVSLGAAALREAEEEIGLPRAVVELAGELDSLSTVASQFTITPFVGLLDAVPQLRTDPREVETAFAVPISELLDPDAYWEEQWELWGDWRSMVFFVLPGETVWGATARILARFLHFLTEARRGPVRSR
jgi:8-oxo-dGTP pyrophosphatase MutT (NUDIX family)